jgi:Tol biopolymer transport system component
MQRFFRLLATLAVVAAVNVRAAAQELLPGEMPVEFGRELIEPRAFPTLRELMTRVERPELGPAIVFRFYGDKHNHFAPQWSPDGRALAVLRSDIDAHTAKIVILPGLDAEKPTVLYAGLDSYDHMFAWAAGGGRAFAFASTNEPSEQENVHVGAVATEPQTKRVTSGPGVKTHPALWLDGRQGQLLFNLAGKLEALRVDLDRADAETSGQPLGDGTEASWSPDGQWLAWTERTQLNAAQSNFTLKVRDVVRKTDQRIFAPPGMLLRNPTWSPDGRHIALYARPISQTSWRLYVLDAPSNLAFRVPGNEQPADDAAAGPAPGKPVLVAQDVRVEEHFQNFGPSWHPRGDRLWFFSRVEDQEYYPLRWATIDGRRRGEVGYPRRLTTGLDVAMNPNPALRAIAFCAIEDLHQDVIVMILNHDPQ